jgi:hypothetical protein
MSTESLAKFVYRDRNLSPQSLASGLRASAGRLVLLLACLAFYSSAAQANGREDYKQHGDLKIFYSAFPSTFIAPEIALANNLTRGVDRGLVNVATMKDLGTGLPTVVSGEVLNIMQQSQTLSFVEIREGSTVYYLAPFDFDNRDYLTFKIRIRANPEAPAYDFKFQKIMYIDR